MKRKLSIVLTIVMALTVLSVAPVSADGEKPINTRIDLTLHNGPCPVDPAPTLPFVTWIGTVVIDGTTYGWADFPTAGPVFEKKFMYFEEYWTIFTLQPDQAPTVALACNPALVVLDGINTGRMTPGATGRADGTVSSAAHPGPFADVAAGSKMIWRGKITSFIGDVPYEFKATLHIFPLK